MPTCNKLPIALRFILCLALAAQSSWQATAQEGLVLGRQGEFGVGYQRLIATDSSRERELQLDVWYPSNETVNDGNFALYHPIPGNEFGFASAIAASNLTVADGRFPLIINSHGGGSWSGQDSDINEVLASHGFVVAAIEHRGRICPGI